MFYPSVPFTFGGTSLLDFGRRNDGLYVADASTRDESAVRRA